MSEFAFWNEPHHPVLFEFDPDYLRDQGFAHFETVHPATAPARIAELAGPVMT